MEYIHTICNTCVFMCTLLLYSKFVVRYLSLSGCVENFSFLDNMINFLSCL